MVLVYLLLTEKSRLPSKNSWRQRGLRAQSVVVVSDINPSKKTKRKRFCMELSNFFNGFLGDFFYFYCRSLFLWNLLCLRFLSHFLEAINTSGCIDNLFLPCIERMTQGADFRVHGFNSRTCFENGTTSTSDSGLCVKCWVNTLFHKWNVSPLEEMNKSLVSWKNNVVESVACVFLFDKPYGTLFWRLSKKTLIMKELDPLANLQSVCYHTRCISSLSRHFSWGGKSDILSAWVSSWPADAALMRLIKGKSRWLLCEH